MSTASIVPIIDVNTERAQCALHHILRPFPGKDSKGRRSYPFCVNISVCNIVIKFYKFRTNKFRRSTIFAILKWCFP